MGIALDIIGDIADVDIATSRYAAVDDVFFGGNGWAFYSLIIMLFECLNTEGVNPNPSKSLESYPKTFETAHIAAHRAPRLATKPPLV